MRSSLITYTYKSKSEIENINEISETSAIDEFITKFSRKRKQNQKKKSHAASKQIRLTCNKNYGFTVNFNPEVAGEGTSKYYAVDVRNRIIRIFAADFFRLNKRNYGGFLPEIIAKILFVLSDTEPLKWGKKLNF